jgi:MinD superfamily P-loop ATPase
MKDLILTKNDTSLVGTLRVDMLSNAPANFTIMAIKDSSGAIVDSLDAIGGFYQRTEQSWAEFLAFCTTNNLKIVSRDQDADTTVLGYQSPAGTHYPVVSITSGTKTIVIATDVTAAFAPTDILALYNADHSFIGRYTHVSDSYSDPDTSIVVSEAIATVGASSGKYIVNEG